MGKDKVMQGGLNSMNKKLTVITPQITPLLPALIAREDERTAERFIDFFAVTIRNKNTRAKVNPFVETENSLF